MKCKYMGDTEFEDCAKCNGDRTDCSGFEQENEPPQKTAQKLEIKGDNSNTSNYVSQAKTSVIRASSGLSAEIKGIWYRFDYTEERILPENCNIEEEKKLLWDAVNREIDEQILQVS